MARRFVRLALVGLPGCGKSTVGQHLARQLGLPFVDSDQVIERRIGCSIRAFFEQHGEAAFRDQEEQVIDELASGAPAVIATGGGAVLRKANRERLAGNCRVIYLQSTPKDLYQRLRNDRKRPLLQVADPQARLGALFAERDALYREVAHLVLETGRLRVAAVVSLIVSEMDKDASTPPSGQS